jgi:hypothetical protein
MEDVGVGTTGLMIDGVYVGRTITVRRLLTDNIFLVEVDEGGQKTLCHIPRDQLILYDPHAPLSEECPFRIDDIVLIHQYHRSGSSGRVTGVSERHSKLLVRIGDETVIESFHSVTLVSSPRRDTLQDYLAAIERAHPFMGHSQRRDFWWADQLWFHGPWDTEEALLRLGEEFMRFRDVSFAEEAADLERRKNEFIEAYGALSHRERAERWQRELEQWVGYDAFTDRFVEQMARRYFTAEEIWWTEEEALRKGPKAFPQLAGDPGVSLKRLRSHAVERRVMDVMMEGYGLSHRARRARRRIPLRERYAAWRAQALPEERELAPARKQARAEVMGSVELLRARIRRSHGIPLPDHVFEFWAWWRGLHPAERKALVFVGVAPIGLFDFFDVEPEGKRGGPEDPRLHERPMRDPPEFFAVLRGGDRGERTGLWYDDPTQLPRLLARYNIYAGTMDVFNGTLLDVVRHHIEECMERLELAEPSDDDWIWNQYALARDSIAAFGPTASALLPPLSGYRIATHDTVGALVRLDDDVDPHALDQLHERAIPSHEQDELELAALVKISLAECAAGDPKRALVCGRDLHWWSSWGGERRDAAVRLLEAAYRALGRPALADLLVLHHRHCRKEPGAPTAEA